MIDHYILITGGTGFIGSALCRSLHEDGHEVIVLTRDRQRAAQRFQGELRAIESLAELDPGHAPDIIVNLAGLSLGSGRWTEQLKQTFVASRVDTTRQLIDYIAQTPNKPKALLSGSAVGYYGARGDEVLQEDAPPGNEFQSDLCLAWETEALKAEAYGVRVCLLRAGVVLGPDGGALSSLLPPFKFGLGGYLGDGKQWLSWIHLYDLVGIVRYLMAHETLTGAFNCTAPEPETNREFARKLGKALNRPVFMRVPAWAVRLQVGEMARLYLTGQRVVPAKLLASGYRFRYPELGGALNDILGPI